MDTGANLLKMHATSDYGQHRMPIARRDLGYFGRPCGKYHSNGKPNRAKYQYWKVSGRYFNQFPPHLRNGLSSCVGFLRCKIPRDYRHLIELVEHRVDVFVDFAYIFF